MIILNDRDYLTKINNRTIEFISTIIKKPKYSKVFRLNFI